jgi:hypothetical protein
MRRIIANSVHSFRSVREEEAGRLLRSVAAAAASAPAVANLSKMLAAYVADSSVRTIIGSRLKDRAAFLALLDHGTKLMAI